MMSATTTVQAKVEAPKDATFSLDVSEQELLDEFGVLSLCEYCYGA
ncbi:MULTISPECIES: hypothetical protein [unclassified Amycolatopsis]|nr:MULTISPECIES: hypothetical protein [unclassified Amycolatopsis]UOZ03576.1 hypothetical protein MUY22_32580 [Amycolatopsis sp. WQ 127309]WSJ79033.1 hypothetical protein OG439_08580 [Amycolatopsis sp. NBC_01307]WSK77481.1 hypothetical protein OG570_39935 [Amycolatopsis sp. NBC_01286]